VRKSVAPDDAVVPGSPTPLTHDGIELLDRIQNGGSPTPLRVSLAQQARGTIGHCTEHTFLDQAKEVMGEPVAPDDAVVPGSPHALAQLTTASIY